MRIRDYLGVSEETQNLLTRLMQILLLLTTIFGFYRGDTGIIINAFIGLLITFIPGLIEKDLEIVMDPALVLWITSAVFFHGIGTLGPYGTIWWWDHFTHALSSSVVAGAGYSALRALDLHYEELHFPTKFFFVFILIFVIAFGVLWELLEFGLSGLAELLGGKTVLTQHGLDDTMKDLLFDTIGGIVVAIFGEIYLLDLVEQIEQKFLS